MNSNFGFVLDLFSFLVIIRGIHLKNKIDNEKTITNLIENLEQHTLVKDWLEFIEEKLDWDEKTVENGK